MCIGYGCYRKDRNCNGGAEAGVQCSLIKSKWPSKRIPDLESMVCIGLGVHFLLNEYINYTEPDRINIHVPACKL